MRYIYLLLLAVVFTSCAKEFRNPYDPATPPDIWMPKAFKLDTLGTNALRLTWIQDEQHIDGFAIQKSTNGQIKEILLPLDSLRYTDTQAVDTSSDEVCPELSYKVMARAGNNRSLDIGTTSGIRMPLSTPANAGTDILVNDTASTVQLNAQAANAGERGQWTVVSGTGGSFSNQNAHNSNFTGTPCTDYVLRWTKSGCTETFDEVSVKFRKAITVANAGANQTYTDGTTQVTLNANNPGLGESGIWTIISGTGGVLENPSLPNTLFTGQSCTDYILRWTITDVCNSSVDEMNMSLQKDITIANAGDNQSFTNGTSQATLNANISGAGESGIWTIISGTGGILENPSLHNTLFIGQSCTNYTLRWTITDVCNSSVDEMNISFQKSTTTANAGANQTITNNTTQVTMSANSAAAGETGTWFIVSGVGGSFSNTNSATSAFTGNSCSSYTLRWTIQGLCSTNYDDVTISFSQSNTIANAGVDQSITTNLTQVTLAANEPLAGEIGIWSIVNGVGGSFSNVNSPTATLNGNACTSYTLRWSIGSCSSNYDDVVISLQQVASQTNAGADQSFTNSTIQTTLAGDAILAGETGLWTVVSGYGGVFANANSPTTQFTGQGCQSYTLKWTKTSCSSSVSDNVVVTFSQAVSICNAGADQTITTSSTQTLLTGNPLQNGETGLWTVESGSGGSFSNASLPNAIFTGLPCQNYTLKWTKISCSSSASDNVVISFIQSVSDANAGDDQILTSNATQVTLTANTPLTGEIGTWSIVSGMGGGFSNVNSPISAFTGNACTNYTLRWTIGACSSNFNDVVISFQQSASQANAGTDQSFTNSTIQTTLTGDAPLLGETGLWTVVSGNGGVFANANSPTSQFTGQGCQSYTLKWTKTSCSSSTSDNVVISFSQTVSSANAGLDQIITSNSTLITLAANTPMAGETGTWTIVNGQGGSFSNSNSPISTFTGVLGQTYILNWTITKCSSTSSDQVTIKYYGVIDIDGNYYSSLLIGTQEWMHENLKTTRYSNGDLIPNITNNSQWYGLSTGSWCYYNNSTSYNTIYGKLYNWYVVADSRNVCPSGWHVPSEAEWWILTNYLGALSLAGGKMKSTGTSLWNSPNTNATNESGFSGFPGGSLPGLFFSSIGSEGNWWSSSPIYFNTASMLNLSYNSGYADIGSGMKNDGNSIRCLKD